MAQAVSTSITRRGVAAGLTVVIALAGAVLGTNAAFAQAKPPAPEKSLYERLGGVFAALSSRIAEGQRSGQFRPDLEPRFAALSCISQIAWFALASPLVAVLLEEVPDGPTAETRAAYGRHAAQFALAALSESS